jgi:hypothetical protein
MILFPEAPFRSNLREALAESGFVVDIVPEAPPGRLRMVMEAIRGFNRYRHAKRKPYWDNQFWT